MRPMYKWTLSMDYSGTAPGKVKNIFLYILCRIPY